MNAEEARQITNRFENEDLYLIYKQIKNIALDGGSYLTTYLTTDVERILRDLDGFKIEFNNINPEDGTHKISW